MCNLYSMTLPQEALRRLFDPVEDGLGNLPALAGIYPDYPAPILRSAAGGGRALSTARWGMPSPAKVLEGRRTDPGVTNVRNTASSSMSVANNGRVAASAIELCMTASAASTTGPVSGSRTNRDWWPGT